MALRRCADDVDVTMGVRIAELGGGGATLGAFFVKTSWLSPATIALAAALAVADAN